MSEADRRVRMVHDHLRGRGVRDERVLQAFLTIPRQGFVPEALRAQAYEDHPLPIGEGQTISQPYIVALMIEALRLRGTEQVLEVGTGSGYQTALLSLLALEVSSVERLPLLAEAALARLGSLKLPMLNVHLRVGDGAEGWPERAPYDAIIVSAATPRVPPALKEQLAEGGRLVLPLGAPSSQTLTLIAKERGQLTSTALGDCVFVPLISSA